MDVKKIIIEIDAESSDLEEGDFILFKQEADVATAINIQVGRPIDGEEEITRSFDISSEYFKVRFE